jgi:serine/threonine protein kinase
MKERSGTLYYMSPELIKAGSVGSSGDIWSIGVIMFVMVETILDFSCLESGHFMVRPTLKLKAEFYLNPSRSSIQAPLAEKGSTFYTS